MPDRPLLIALPWHNLGHGNLGIDALTRSNIALLERAAKEADRTPSFITLCGDARPSADTMPPNVEIGPMPNIKPLLKGRSPFLSALRRSDVVVDIGEGDSWADIYGNKRFAFHAGTKIATLALGKPLVLAPQTIGPFNNELRRKFANTIMKRCRAVFSRDGLSTTYLHDNGLVERSGEFIDVAFSLPFDHQTRTKGKIRVGLNVSGLLYRGGYTGRNELGLTIDYATFTHRLIEALLTRPGVEITLIAHVTAKNGNDDDCTIMPDIINRYPQVKPSPSFASASEAKSFMSGLDFVVGGRMHACIGAFSACTPVVPIAYSRKFNGLFDTLGYTHYVDGKKVDNDTALEQTLTAFEKRDRLATDIDTGLGIASIRLDKYVSAMADVFRSLE